jgi:hypothetical protein
VWLIVSYLSEKRGGPDGKMKLSSLCSLVRWGLNLAELDLTGFIIVLCCNHVFCRSHSLVMT